jgi:two-component system, NarL family, nitrate/nitrite response regulator NarL
MKTMIVDDHPLVRKGLSTILSHDSKFEVVAEGSCVEEGISQYERHAPELTLIDLRLKDKSGLDIAAWAKSMNMNGKFIVVASVIEKGDFERAEELGIDGYLLKDALPEEFLYALKLVGQGRKYYDPGLLEYIKKDEGDIELLTKREKDVLLFLGKGFSNNYIAKNLYISEYTVKKHVSQILSKLNLKDRTQVALYANSKGITKYL